MRQRQIALCEWATIPEGLSGAGGREPMLLSVIRKSGHGGIVTASDGPNGLLICEVEAEPEHLEKLKDDSRFAFHGTKSFGEWCVAKRCEPVDVEKRVGEITIQREARELKIASGQLRAHPRGTKPKAPSLINKMWNFAKAVASFALNPRLVTKEQYAERLAICDACPNRKGKHCNLCGCNLAAKARAVSQVCPDKPSRWPPLESFP